MQVCTSPSLALQCCILASNTIPAPQFIRLLISNYTCIHLTGLVGLRFESAVCFLTICLLMLFSIFRIRHLHNEHFSSAAFWTICKSPLVLQSWILWRLFPMELLKVRVKNPQSKDSTLIVTVFRGFQSLLWHLGLLFSMVSWGFSSAIVGMYFGSFLICRLFLGCCFLWTFLNFRPAFALELFISMISTI